MEEATLKIPYWRRAYSRRLCAKLLHFRKFRKSCTSLVNKMFDRTSLVNFPSQLVRMKHHIPLLFLSFFLPQSYSQEPTVDLGFCMRPFDCGRLKSLSYPFWADVGEVGRPLFCGGRYEFKLYNCSQTDLFPSIQINSQEFQVLDINLTANIIKMNRSGLAYDTCDPSLTNNSFSFPLFQCTQNVYNITLFYDCPVDVTLRRNFRCPKYDNAFYVEDAKLDKYPKYHDCEHRVQLQVSRSVKASGRSFDEGLREFLEGGFEVKYDIEDCKRCIDSNGVCGRNDRSEYQFSCLCPDGTEAPLQCPNRPSVAAGISGFLVGIIIYCCRRKSSSWKVNSWITKKGDLDVEAFLKNHGDLNLKRYKFSDIKKMTNSFKEKLGQGGFGVVYKGKLLNGCPVAVKILNAAKKNGADFINEVASISRTSHVNVVTLLGFSFEGHKKALIYEFMANGSLDKFIYKSVPETTPSLSWENLNDIAKGIARGLEYLHRGCNTRILHFDIKPHNILLDENFCPQISDFGLAKLCPRKESIISMSDARGTIGYVAPEVWNRHFGGASHKSDVYSYGMMLLEMAGGRKNINAEASHSSEIYFPHWIYKRLEMNSDFGHNGVVATKEDEIVKKMTVVGLWCIQTFPNDRPTMSKVIEMLEGNMNSLEVPPKPVLSSPTRSIPELSSPTGSIPELSSPTRSVPESATALSSTT